MYTKKRTIRRRKGRHAEIKVLAILIACMAFALGFSVQGEKISQDKTELRAKYTDGQTDSATRASSKKSLMPSDIPRHISPALVSISTNNELPTKSVSAARNDDSVTANPTVRHYKPLHCSNGVYSLSEAARAGEVGLVGIRLKEGYPVNLRNEEGMTPLHLAAQAGHKDVVRLLLSRGADAMARDRQQRTPLGLAQDEGIRTSLRAACVARERELDLFDEVKQGDTASLRTALQEGLDPNVTAADGQTPILIVATEANNLEAVKMLLWSGAAPGRTAADGKTALHVAADKGATEIALALLQQGGADPWVQAGNGATALHEAVWFNRLDTLRALLPYYRKANYSPRGGWVGTPAEMAIGTGRAEILQAMIKAGMQVNHSCFREPLLIAAAKKGNPAIVKILLQAGARKDVKDSQGKTAADYASNELLQFLR